MLFDGLRWSLEKVHRSPDVLVISGNGQMLCWIDAFRLRIRFVFLNVGLFGDNLIINSYIYDYIDNLAVLAERYIEKLGCRL